MSHSAFPAYYKRSVAEESQRTLQRIADFNAQEAEEQADRADLAPAAAAAVSAPPTSADDAKANAVCDELDRLLGRVPNGLTPVAIAPAISAPPTSADDAKANAVCDELDRLLGRKVGQ
jgi:hypothetical protein